MSTPAVRATGGTRASTGRRVALTAAAAVTATGLVLTAAGPAGAGTTRPGAAGQGRQTGATEHRSALSASCTASMQVNAWLTGFNASIQVTAGPTGTSSWTFTVTLPAGTTVGLTQATKADATTGTVHFSNQVYNGTLPAGHAIWVGFTGAGAPPAPGPLVCSAT
ncbi:cellulose binding domain-containing protein [Micromonospora haikouensis]|uniref:cellulose binding domain-containing protein n=1 Tax=Micromonospora haikouensis TaxID=686309 RepID=UPI0037A406CB